MKTRLSLLLLLPLLLAVGTPSAAQEVLRPGLRPVPLKLLPDLVVRDLALDRGCHVVVRLENRGPGRLPDAVWTHHHPKSAGVYLERNGHGWGGASIWKLDPGRALQPKGGTATYTSKLTVSGTQAITARVDKWNVVKEAHEDNNVRTERLTCGGASPKPGDLSVKLDQCPAQARPGQALGDGFRVTGRSTFRGRLEKVAVDIVLTARPTYPSPAPYANYSPHYSDGVLLKGGREHVTFRGPGSVKVKLNGRNEIPADTPRGVYYLGAVIDAGNQHREANEGNNAAFCRIRIAAPAPALSEDCVRFDPDNARVVQRNGRWKIVDGSHWLFDFGGNRREARQALRIIKHYGANQSCFVGRPDPSLEYLLVNGRAPAGRLSGEDCITFDPGRIAVRRVSGHWKIVEDGHWMFDFGSDRAEARKALSIIRHHGFTHSCFVGRPDPSLEYLRR